MNGKLPNEVRNKAGIAMFTISEYYKPKTPLSIEIYQKITGLDPENPENRVLGEKFMREFDKKQYFSFYS